MHRSLTRCFGCCRKRGYAIQETPRRAHSENTLRRTPSGQELLIVDEEQLCYAVCRDKLHFLEEKILDPTTLQQFKFRIASGRSTHVITLAVICACPNILKYLLQRSRCDPNTDDELFSTPLEVLLLSWDCRPSEIPLILSNTRTNLTSFTPVHDIFEFQRKYIPNDRSWKKWLSNRESCLRLLCQHGADVMQRFVYIPVLPLEYAIIMSSESCLQVATVLVDYGADVNRGIHPSTSPLTRAVSRTIPKMVRFLLECGARTESDPGDDFNSAVFSCFIPPGGNRGIYFHGKSVEILELLMKFGADVNSTDPDNDRTVLLSATMDPREPLSLKFCRILLRYGAQETINSPDIAGYTPLLAACQRGDLETIPLLLEHGALSSVNLSYESPLFMILDNVRLLDVTLHFYLLDPINGRNRAFNGPQVDMFNKVLNMLLDSGSTVQLRDGNGLLPKLCCFSQYENETATLQMLSNRPTPLRYLCRHVIRSYANKANRRPKLISKLLPNSLSRFVFENLLWFAPLSGPTLKYVS